MKKWTFLVASAMLVGATPVFTGCIDNDEPEGISVLRGAKAELLRAKVAVEQANAISIKADAVLKEAQAKVQEALAANELAKAKILEAQAKQEEAKVELIKTQNEQEKARLEEQIKEYERVQKEWQAEMDRNATEAEQAIKEWELSYKEAQVAYEKVLVELATAKATLTAKQNKILEPLVTAVKNNKDIYDTKVADVRKKQTMVLKASQFLEETEANKELYTRELEWNLKTAKLYQEGAEKRLEAINKELEKVQAMEPTGLAVRQTELLAEQKKATAEYADAKLALIDKKKELQPEYDKLAEMKTEAENMLVTDIVIPEFTYTFPNIGVPGSDFQGEKVINEEQKYTLAEKNGYYNAQETYTDYINSLKEIFSTENDRAWLAEYLVELKNERTEAQKRTAEAFKLWKQAADAYRTGTLEADLSKFEGYAELGTDIEAYNKLGEAYNKALEAYKDAFGKADASTQYDIYKTAKSEAVAKKQEALVAADREYGETINGFYKISSNLSADLEVKNAEFQKAADLVAADPTNETLKKAMEEAEKAYNDAEKLYTDHSNKWGETQTAAKKVKSEKETIAYDDYTIAEAKAWKEYQANISDEQLLANLEAARKKLEEAKDLALEELNTVFVSFGVYYNSTYYSANRLSLLYSEDYNLRNELEVDLLDVKEVAAIDKSKIEQVVIDRSSILYGRFDDNGVKPRLVALEKADIKDIIAKQYTKLESWFYISFYKHFGLLGQEMFLDAQIEILEARYNNPDIVDKALAEFENRLKALNDTYEAAGKAHDDALVAIEAKDAEIADALLPFKEEIEKKQNAITTVDDLLNAIDEAIGDVKEEGGIVYSEEMLKRYVAAITYFVGVYEKDVYDAETEVMNKEKDLADWNKGVIRLLDMAKKLLEEAETVAATAKENLDIAQDALDAAIAKMTVEE